MKKIQSLRAIFDTPMHRRSFLLGSMALPLAACGGGGGSSGTAPPPSQLAATIRFSQTTSGALLDSNYAGLSYEKTRINLFNPGNTNLINLFQLLGNNILRLGGNTTDETSLNGQIPGTTAINQSQLSNLATFLQATGWKVLYGINLAGSNQTPNPTNARQEAQAVATTLGSSLLGFEIGNEPDLYVSDQNYRAPGWGYSNFLSEWYSLANTIKTAAPGIPLTGPASAHNYQQFTNPFAHDAANSISTLTHHYYIANGQDPASTISKMLQPDLNLTKILQSVTQSAAAASIGFRMAECNSFYDGGSAGVSNSYASALWVLDYLFTCAMSQCQGVNLHGGGGSLYSALTDNGTTITSVNPLFYGIMLFSLAAQGRAYHVDLSVNDPSANFSAYGVSRNDGGQNILIINKDSSRASQTTVQFASNIRNVRQWTLSGPSLNSLTGTQLNGTPISISGSWSNTPSSLTTNSGSLAINIPPISAILLQST
ncbi:hypothetical protein [Chromobacterium amazonense]|uniref:Beta-glucuronidase C-terminal domain-containing protein n=1 Tax=Chromobacterium amazonense TaxID=1382803 RepID=A0ABU8V587_9NEIS|nr:hypothetical protein [Chromobacterium amazonense]MDQ4540260.1 hypothetical protein [Chromobacterium amazonense]